MQSPLYFNWRGQMQYCKTLKFHAQVHEGHCHGGSGPVWEWEPLKGHNFLSYSLICKIYKVPFPGERPLFDYLGTPKLPKLSNSRKFRLVKINYFTVLHMGVILIGPRAHFPNMQIVPLSDCSVSGYNSLMPCSIHLTLIEINL